MFSTISIAVRYRSVSITKNLLQPKYTRCSEKPFV